MRMEQENADLKRSLYGVVEAWTDDKQMTGPFRKISDSVNVVPMFALFPTDGVHQVLGNIFLW